MQRTGHQFFSRPRLSQNHYGRRSGRHTFNHVKNFLNFSRLSDNPLKLLAIFPSAFQLPDFFHQLIPLPRFFNQVGYFFDIIKRFCQIIIGPHFDGTYRTLHTPHAGDHNNLGGKTVRFYLFQHLNAIHPRQVDIQHRHLHRRGIKDLECFFSVSGDFVGPMMVAAKALKYLHQCFIIVYN